MNENDKFENRLLIREYSEYCKYKEGLQENTISSRVRAIYQFEKIVKKQFCVVAKSDLIDYRNALEDCENISQGTLSNKITSIKRFFLWCKEIKKYQIRLSINDIEYLNQLLSTKRLIKSLRNIKEAPSLQYVIELLKSIKAEGEIALRDRAIIAFLLCSGLRVETIISITFKVFDVEKYTVDCDPRKGVNIKFDKAYINKLLKFDQYLFDVINEYLIYLKDHGKMYPDIPIFPSTITELSGDIHCFHPNGISDIRWKTTSPINKILTKRAQEAQLRSYTAHAYRRAHARIAHGKCNTAKELMAVSRNMGHESISTTEMYYIQMDSHQMIEILDKTDFSVDSSDSTMVKKLVQKQNQMCEKMDKMCEKIDKVLSRTDKNKRK